MAKPERTAVLHTICPFPAFRLHEGEGIMLLQVPQLLEGALGFGVAVDERRLDASKRRRNFTGNLAGRIVAGSSHRHLLAGNDAI
jgi:hypothetical protein